MRGGVREGITKVKAFRTSDGTHFDDYNEAVRHESKMRRKAKIELLTALITNTVHGDLILDEDTLESLIERRILTVSDRIFDGGE